MRRSIRMGSRSGEGGVEGCGRGGEMYVLWIGKSIVHSDLEGHCD